MTRMVTGDNSGPSPGPGPAPGPGPGQLASTAVRSFRLWLASAIASLALAACETIDTPAPVRPPARPPVVSPPTAPPAPPTALPSGPSFALREARFNDLPDWQSADAARALGAFQRSCQRLRARDPNAKLGANAAYGGIIADWLPACASADAADPARARQFFEQNFTLFAVESTGGQAKLTGYYEPVFAARRAPEGSFSEPILARPADLLRIDLQEFARAVGSGPDTTLRGTLWGRVTGQTVVPYPERAALPADLRAIAWAHPADLYDLQVQGSGRLLFPDGSQSRAAYSAPNGRKWNSIFIALRDRGLLPAGELTFAGVRAWMDRTPREMVREILNTDPSVIFFDLEPVTEPLLGPRGAQGVPLTAMGSAAVDPAFHPYGAVLFIAARGPKEGGGEQPLNVLVVAQDTGGAIRRGPLRADLFYGTGPEAGARAGRQNANDPRFWTLLPKGLGALAQNAGQRAG